MNIKQKTKQNTCLPSFLTCFLTTYLFCLLPFLKYQYLENMGKVSHLCPPCGSLGSKCRQWALQQEPLPTQSLPTELSHWPCTMFLCIFSQNILLRLYYLLLCQDSKLSLTFYLLLNKLSFPVSINTRSHSFSKAIEYIYFYTNAFLKYLSLRTTLHQFLALLTYKTVFVILEKVIYTLVPYPRCPVRNAHKRSLSKLKP